MEGKVKSGETVRIKLQMKTLIRTPLKTVLTFMLLAAVSFALFSRVGEYAIVNREIKNAAKSYKGVGSVEVQPNTMSFMQGTPYYLNADSRINPDDYQEYQYKPLTEDQMESVKALPYVTSWSTRYMTSGVSDQYLRMDEGPVYYDYMARIIVEGTLKDIKYHQMAFGSPYNELILDNLNYLAGDASLFPNVESIKVRAYPDRISGTATSMDRDRVTLIRDESHIWDTEYLNGLEIGARCVVVCRVYLFNTPMLFLGDYLTNRWCEAIQCVEGEPADYLSTEKFAALSQLVEITNADRHTFDVVYTDDLSVIIRFAESKMAIKSGRGLSGDDSIEGNKVCVVSDEFAYTNGLSVGDNITLSLGTELFEQYKGLGAIAATRERYKRAENPTEFEIVGIYIDTDGKTGKNSQLNWNYSINTIFVPKSLLPLNEAALSDHLFSPGEFSFTVGDAWTISPFLEEVTPRLEQMGLKLIFHDGGWRALEEQFRMTSKLSLIAISTILAALVAASGFIVYLYIGRKKKEYAIMRALGTTKKTAAKSLLFPLLIVCMISIVTGCITGCIYTSESVAKTNTALQAIKGYSIDSSVPLSVIVSCAIGELGLLALLAAYGLWKLGENSPLSLLQEQQGKSGRINKTNRAGVLSVDIIGEDKIDSRAVTPYATVTSYIADFMPKAPFAPTMNEHPKQTLIGEWRHVLTYTIRHLIRAPWKSILGIVVSALLLGAAGQFAIMQQSYADLFDSIDVEAKFMNGLTLVSLHQILNTGFVDEPYYEGSGTVELESGTAEFVLTRDLERYTGEEVAVTYADGYDQSCMRQYGKVCIVGKKLMDQYVLQLGSEVHISVWGMRQFLEDKFVTEYRSEHPGEGISDDMILELCHDELLEEYTKQGDYYVVAGVVASPSGRFDEVIFSPGNLRVDRIFGYQLPLDLAEFHLAENGKAAELRSYANMIAGKEVGGYRSSRLSFLMDTSKIDQLKGTMTLLRVLYPVVIAAVVLIGGFLFGLMVIQSAKEAAILRVLGTTRLRTRTILVMKQFLVCVVGIAMGMLGLFVWNRGAFYDISNKLLFIAGLYTAGGIASALICSTIVTHRKSLELLQTKE